VGAIYKGHHEGWYSVVDECFYKESQTEIREDPSGAKIKVSKETGSAVEWTSEENYCFKLSKFQEALKKHYETYPEAIIPRTYYEDVMKALSEPLEDLSISRPRSRLSWGIEVPGDPEQTIYVWFDALVNYLTVTGYPWLESGRQKEAVEESNKKPSTAPITEEATPEPIKLPSTKEVQKEKQVQTGLAPVKANAWPADVHVIGKDIVR
jgi:methionyl-tRNA synthetase